MTGRASLLRSEHFSAANVLRVWVVVMLLFSGALFVDYAVFASESTVDAASAADDTPTAGEPTETPETASNGSDGPTPTTESPSVDSEAHSNDSNSTDREELTVVPEQTGPLKVYNETGDLVYEYEEYARYWDVDPSPEGERTLLFVSTAWASSDACDGDQCQRNIVGRLNLTTGEHTELFSRTYTDDRGSNQWHDVDRVNDTHVVVAGIKHNRVFIANTETDEITWQWNASEHYSEEQGGGPYDWTHLNDVELLEDGRIMASVRNMDEMVFIEPGEGVDDSWTLGEDDNHDIIYEQHNADYIPPERGGPAVIVADSHNNRIVEYQRVEGTWRQTWEWTDVQAQWTRDGDRLPDGHTLITDTNGGRVLEVDMDGEIVWAVEATKAYEAERLGTGDESATGKSMVLLRAPGDWNSAPGSGSDGNQSDGWTPSSDGNSSNGENGSSEFRLNESQFAELQNSGSQSSGAHRSDSFSLAAWQVFKDNAPPYLLNSLLFVLSPWIDPVQLLPLLIAAVALVVWGSCELYWRFKSPLAARISGAFGQRGD